MPYGILKYTKPLPVVYVIVAGLKIVLMVVLMPSMKIYGVIVAGLVSSALEVVLLRTSIRDMFQFRFNFFKIVGAPMMLFLLIMALEPIIGFSQPYLVHSIYLFACGGLLWWAYRNEIQLINPFQSK